MSAFIQEKETIVNEIKEKLEKAQSAVVIDYLGITVAQADILRRKMREANVEYKIYKNTMVKRAIQGTEFEPLTQVLEGPSAFAFGYEDAIAPARVLSGVMKEFKKMEFKAGVVEGKYFDAESMKLVASMPSRDELIAKFLGSIKSPLSNLAYVLNGIAEQKAEA